MSIPKGLIIYRGAKNFSTEDMRRVLKYGREQNFMSQTYCNNYTIPLMKRILKDKRSKRLPASEISYSFPSNQNKLMPGLKRLASLRRLKLASFAGYDFDVYHSEYSTDSQYSVTSDRPEDPEVLTFPTPFEKASRKTAKRIFKQAKRLKSFTLFLSEMNKNHNHIFHYLPFLANLEKLLIKIKIQGPNDLLRLKTLLALAKKRNYWPHLKSMVIKLRHSWNRQNCTPRFTEFCQNLQDLTEIINDSPWIKMKLKIKYLNRLQGSDVLLKLRETLEKIPQLDGLSLVVDSSKDLVPLLPAIEGMENLKNCSLRFRPKSEKQPSTESGLIQSLSKVKSLKNIRIDGNDLLLENDQDFLDKLGDLTQITSLDFQGQNQTIDPRAWSLVCQSVPKLSQLETLIFKTRVSEISQENQENLHIEDFFIGLLNLQNLRILNFEMSNFTESFKNVGRQLFPAFCQSLQSLTKLEKVSLYFPCNHSTNSDILNLANTLPLLRNLQEFSLDFYQVKMTEPVENKTLMELSNALQGLQNIRSFKMKVDLTDVCELTYEILSHLCKYFKQRKTLLELRFDTSDQVDELLLQKLNALYPEFYLIKK